MKLKTTDKQFAPYAKNLIVSPFCITLINGWQGLSDILNQAYCSESSKVNLGLVCKKCSELEFISATRYSLGQKFCPHCSAPLVLFWAPFRTQYYFDNAYNSFGSVAHKKSKWQGFVWGYERHIEGVKGNYWYMDMIIISSMLWGTRKGIACCYALFEGIKEQARDKGYSSLIGRTQVNRSPMKGMFVGHGGQFIGLDPRDKERELWQFNI